METAIASTNTAPMPLSSTFRKMKRQNVERQPIGLEEESDFMTSSIVFNVSRTPEVLVRVEAPAMDW